MNVGTPLLAALIICMTAALVSAFASTTGILAALVPLAVPLATSGAVSDWALICALSVCASIVDVSPFSTTGATLVASAPPEERDRDAPIDDALGDVDGRRRSAGIRACAPGSPRLIDRNS